MSTTWSARSLALVPTSRWARSVLIALAISAAIASIVAGGAAALAAAALAAVLVLALAAILADPVHRHRVIVVALGILLARIVITSVLHVLLQQQNEGGAMFEDDFGYVKIGEILARMWGGEIVPDDRMPPQFDASTVHSYSRTIGALFLVFGPNVAVAKIANTTLLLIAALFLYRTTLLIATRNAAMLALSALALWPSLALWTSLTLKEGMALFSAVGTTWAVTELIRRPHIGWFLAVLVFTLPLQDARPYLHAILLGLWPVALTAARLLSGRPRLIWSIAAAVAAAVAISGVRPGLALSPGLVGNAEDVRIGMAEGARSAIVEATRQFQATPGSCFSVRIPGSTVGNIQRVHRVHLVAPNTPLVYAERSTTDIKPPQSGVPVHDGDVVCVRNEGGPSPTVAGSALRPGVTVPPGIDVKPAALPAEPPGIDVKPAASPAEVFVTTTGSTRLTNNAEGGSGLTPGESGIGRSLSYLPRGALFLVGAPFPWDIAPYPVRWPLVFEMTLWYMVAALALVGLVVVVREKIWSALFVVLVGFAVAGVLSLVEGNLGTLIRHRGMVIPYAIVLASLVAARWSPVQKLAR